MAVGLAKQQYVDAFVQETLKQIGAAEKKTNPAGAEIVKTETARTILIYLFNLLTGWLKTEGMSYEIRLRIEPVGGFGAFSNITWEMTLDKSYFEKTALSVNKLKELAVTLYHECRHGEQYFLMARYLWIDFPKLSAEEIQKKLTLVEERGATDLDAVKTAKFARLEKKSEEYALAKKLYEGEFASFQKQHGNKPLPLNELGKLLLESTHERVAANNKFDDAQAYARTLRAEIKAYNNTKPTTKPNPIDVKCPGAADDLQKSNPPGDDFLRAYEKYLQLRRIFAATQFQASYVSYILAAIESDAHAVETSVRTRLQMDAIGAKTSNIPVPKDWTAVPKPIVSSSAAAAAALPPGFPKKPNYPPPRPPGTNG